MIEIRSNIYVISVIYYPVTTLINTNMNEKKDRTLKRTTVI